MNKIIIWARVSSREQAEGYSIDAQMRATRDRAQHLGLTVVREFAVVESARHGADRDEFHAMIAWVRAQAKKSNVHGIMAHKLDRMCRNMGDAVLLRNLESECGVRLYFCDNHFASGPAGVFNFNILAAVGQYYSDNLRTEVLKGMHEKVRQGWPMGRNGVQLVHKPM
jgi:site-specific DNA recombinase